MHGAVKLFQNGKFNWKERKYFWRLTKQKSHNWKRRCSILAYNNWFKKIFNSVQKSILKLEWRSFKAVVILTYSLSIFMIEANNYSNNYKTPSSYSHLRLEFYQKKWHTKYLHIHNTIGSLYLSNESQRKKIVFFFIFGIKITRKFLIVTSENISFYILSHFVHSNN